MMEHIVPSDAAMFPKRAWSTIAIP